MKPLIRIARATAALLLLWNCTASAEEWRKARPGTTTLQEVLSTFGKPSGRTTTEQTLTLSYSHKAAPQGTRAVTFQFSKEDELLRRIEVTPSPAPQRASIEETFGPACQEDTPPETSCHELAATPLNQLAFHYRTRGVEVLFESRRVLSLVYTEPQRRQLTPPPRAEAPAEPHEEQVADSEPVAVKTPMADATTASGTSMDSLMRPVVVTTSDTPAESDMGVQRQMPVFDGELVQDKSESQPRDHLSFGGLYYQRAELSSSSGPTGSAYRPSLPSLLDLVLEVKPAESTRGLIRARLLFDPLDRELTSPSAVLDQFWFQFNVAQRVFISAGRQQIKWGSARVWNTTDFLRQPNPRPFDAFDLRTGIDMLKVTVPWESMAANLVLISTVDLNGTRSSPVRYGGAVRAEVAPGVGELALTAAFGQGRRPRYGADWSMGLGPLDIYAEAALVRDSNVTQWERTEAGIVQWVPNGSHLLASGGMSATFRLADVFRTFVRVEGFYNSLGYADPALLNWVLTPQDRPLFPGRYYAMAQITVSRRSQFEPNFTLTTVVNPLDRSGMGRFDVLVYALRDVIVQGFVEMPYGQGGEFRALPKSQVFVFNTGLSVRIKM